MSDEDKPKPYTLDRERYVIVDDSIEPVEPAWPTGIYVRAQDHEGRWRSADISMLDLDSLRRFLRARGGDNPWAESLVEALLKQGIYAQT